MDGQSILRVCICALGSSPNADIICALFCPGDRPPGIRDIQSTWARDVRRAMVAPAVASPGASPAAPTWKGQGQQKNSPTMQKRKTCVHLHDPVYMGIAS